MADVRGIKDPRNWSIEGEGVKGLRPGDERVQWMFYDHEESGLSFEAIAERDESRGDRLLGFDLFTREIGEPIHRRKRVARLLNEYAVARFATQLVSARMSMGLRRRAIRVAYENPGPVRDALLPLLKR